MAIFYYYTYNTQVFQFVSYCFSLHSLCRDDRRPPYHEFAAERAYYENIRTPGLYPEDARREYAARSRDRFPELEHYQGDHFDPRYHDDPRDYRDYRDPFEQDIRKYTYIQRERERERERFEADRSRWSPSHSRRTVTPSVSPSPSERAPRDSERRVYSQSSERSGSASSMSSPHFDKSEKTLPEHSSKSEKASQVDRPVGAEKTKRAKRKEKGDKDKAEKSKSRKAKGQSPTNSLPESELDTGFEGGSGRVKAPEQDANDRQKSKGDGDTGAPPLAPLHEPIKSEGSKSENVDFTEKNRVKKHPKSEPGSEGKESSMESDRLAARKRRFADSGGRAIRQKRSRHDEEESIQASDFGTGSTHLKESEVDKQKDSQRKEIRVKSEKSGNQKDCQDDLRGQREKPEGPTEPLDSKRHPGPTSSRKHPHEGITEQSSVGEQEHHSALKLASQNAEPDKKAKTKEDHVDIDLSQSYRKQMEQNRRLNQQKQQRESDKTDKPGSPQGSDTEDLEHRSLVHEVGKPPEDVTDNFPSHKLKKLEQYDADQGMKRERVYRSFRQKSEDPEWNSTASPGHQHFPQHNEEDTGESSHKELTRGEEKNPPDPQLLGKRTQSMQGNKPNTPVLSAEEEQQKRWESRVKQDFLPDLNFARTLSKSLHNHKRMDYGVWPDLEPGEVRSDPEEDRYAKSHSAVPSTSAPLSERPRVDRFSDPKLAHLERNKFYSFALDQTITPDTKALLERAKSLSSSREDNWSFLDYDSHFASLRNRKDAEKVESAPRPTPSWYMKKKKIRSESEDKLDDRKEEPKPEEPERRELFASRFLHSAVFELDSRRLQHLERKHEEPDHAANPQPGQQGAVDGELDTGPVVLFHSRFLELTRLQQQKNKAQQPLPETKDDAADLGEKAGQINSPQEQQPQPPQQPMPPPKMVDPVRVPEEKPLSPAEEVISEAQPTTISVTQTVSKDSAPPEETDAAENPPAAPEPPISLLDEAKEGETVAPALQQPPEMTAVAVSEPLATPGLPDLDDKGRLSSPEGDLQIVIEDVKSPATDKPGSRDSHEFLSSSETEMDLEATQPEVPDGNVQKPAVVTGDLDVATAELSSTCKEPEEEKAPPITKAQLPTENAEDKDEESVAPPQKDHKAREMKAKKSKPSPVHVTPVPVLSASSSEKQATRKSERIDKEKLKRGSSPRAELRSAGKSPVHGLESDPLEQQSIPLGRARRRNVKSVYATPVEDDAPVRPGKDAVESPRPARKRTDKSATQQNSEQDPPAPAPTTKRGRPPKNRKLCEDRSAAKVEKSKLDTKDTDSNESENGEQVPKTPKGKSSPHVTKAPSAPLAAVVASGSTKKGDRIESEECDQDVDFTEDNFRALQDSSSSRKEDSAPKVDHKEERDKQSRDEKLCEGKSNGKEMDSVVVEEKDRTVKGKSKLTRTSKSPVLKDLKITLNVTEVKDLLQMELGHQEDLYKKVVPTDGDSNIPKREASCHVKENALLEKKELENPKSFISQEQELEQAVENIAKLTEPTFPAEPPAQSTPPPELKVDAEEEKPSNPASETELMAAIDSITSEESIPINPAPPLNEDVGSEPELQDFIQPPKEEKLSTDLPVLQEESVFHATPKKVAKGRLKTPKRSKVPKQVKKDLKEEQLGGEELAAPLMDNALPAAKAAPETAPSATVATVITPTARKPEPEPSVAKPSDGKTELGPPTNEHVHSQKASTPQPQSPKGPKPPQVPLESIPTSPPQVGSNRPNVRPLPPMHHRNPASPPDWHHSKETGLSASPVVILPSKETQALPPDAENVEIEHSTSDLRQILMKNKNMSLPGSSSVFSNLSMREHNPSDGNIPAKSSVPEARVPPHAAPAIVRSPASLPSPETKSVISVIASTGTSVISRVCNPPEPEDKVNANIANIPCLDMPLPKPTYRCGKEETVSYHGSSVCEDGGSTARFIVDSASLGTGSCPGLRVNTSEGVVVLSHSGQKTEGPQRISAKISQIPQASAGDIESQQLVPIPQIKQEMYGHSHSGLQKGPSSQADHGHPAKMQPNLPPLKQESGVLEKMDSAYQTGPQGVVKRLSQSNPQTVSYHQEYMSLKHQKKLEGADSHGADAAKASWTSAISPAISPHLPSPPGNHGGFLAGSGDRAPPHIGGVKQEPRSPRKSGHPHSPFAKVSSPIGSSSPKAIPVMLSSGLPAMQQYMSGVHHPEQSVIMTPHSVPGGLGRMSPHCATQSIPVGHLVQGDVRVNTPPLSVMSYGMHGDSLAPPWSGPLQPRPSSPQAVGRDKVLKVNLGSMRSHEGEQEEPRRFHQSAVRPPSSQLKAENMPSDARGPLRNSVQLESYMMQRDMRLLLHQQGERLAEPLSGHMQEALPSSSASSSLPLSLSPRAHVLTKGVSEKDMTKPMEAKRPHSPLPKEGMMIRQSGQAMASPQRVPLMAAGPGGSFPEYSAVYSKPRSIHPQIPEMPAGLNQPSMSVPAAAVSPRILTFPKYWPR